jgi:ATP-binding cassette, subfamily B, bacterial
VVIGNIRGADDESALAVALTGADAASVVEGLPAGLDQYLSKVYRDGVDLSGGQWQRVALSRALFRSAGLLVLDEPTAAVDARAEYEIFARLHEASDGRTTIVISHRFSTVRKADRILVMGDGRVLEEGSHDELMQISDGVYRGLFELQAEGYR